MTSSPTQPRRSHRARFQRTASRTIHLVAAGYLGAIIYAPASISDALRPGAAFIVIPAAAITGLFLWRQAQFRALLRWVRRGPTVG